VLDNMLDNMVVHNVVDNVVDSVVEKICRSHIIHYVNSSKSANFLVSVVMSITS